MANVDGADGQTAELETGPRATAIHPLAFVLRFLALLVAALLLEAGLWSQPEWISGYTQAVAWLGAKLYSAFGGDVLRQGSTLHPGLGDSIVIVKTCTMTPAFALYAAAVLATPARWRRRFWGLLIGWVALEALNALRVALLLAASAHRPTWLAPLHESIAPVVLLLLTLLIYLMWVVRAHLAPEAKAA